MKNLNKLNKFRIANVLNQKLGNLHFGDDKNGHFMIAYQNTNVKFFVIATNHNGWDHISVSLKNRCPNWIEMCFVKDLFFDEDEVVIQIHPKKGNYVNLAKSCLHLWKDQNNEFGLPEECMVI